MNNSEQHNLIIVETKTKSCLVIGYQYKYKNLI